MAVQWLNQALCFYQSLCLVDSESLRNRHLRVAANRYVQPYCDTTNIKLNGFEWTFLNTKRTDMTAITDSQRKEVLFFATAHFLFFNFLPAAQVAHFVLPQPHNPIQRQNKKSHFFQRFNYFAE